MLLFGIVHGLGGGLPGGNDGDYQRQHKSRGRDLSVILLLHKTFRRTKGLAEWQSGSTF